LCLRHEFNYLSMIKVVERRLSMNINLTVALVYYCISQKECQVKNDVVIKYVYSYHDSAGHTTQHEPLLPVNALI